MNPESISSVWDFLRKLYPEFLGGAVAYWTHHWFHRIWHSTEKVPALLRALTRRGRRSLGRNA